jgi:ribosome-binding protein aMBF1 (putative translation factor)
MPTVKVLKKPRKKRRNTTPRDLVPGFASLVKQKRTEFGWTQKELSERSGISPMCISDLEAEHRSPSLRVATAVARALALNVRLAAPTEVQYQRA